MIRIVEIAAPGPLLEEIKLLFGEYALSLGEDLSFQGFSGELEDPLIKYGPPGGCILLGTKDGLPAACGALHSLAEPGACEMKRLYVRPAFRGLGLGRQLAAELIRKGRDLGYRTMYLDSLEKLVPALLLYDSLGFVRCGPFYPNPLPGVVYMKKLLDS
jgi:putative acetyltransferase